MGVETGGHVPEGAKGDKKKAASAFEAMRDIRNSIGGGELGKAIAMTAKFDAVLKAITRGDVSAEDSNILERRTKAASELQEQVDDIEEMKKLDEKADLSKEEEARQSELGERYEFYDEDDIRVLREDHLPDAVNDLESVVDRLVEKYDLEKESLGEGEKATAAEKMADVGRRLAVNQRVAAENRMSEVGEILRRSKLSGREKMRLANELLNQVERAPEDPSDKGYEKATKEIDKILDKIEGAIENKQRPAA